MLNKLMRLTVIALLSWSSFVSSEVETLPILSGVGGDFSAINADGEAIEFSRFIGKVVVIAFGYTNCADICPFTLGYLKRLYAALSADEQEKMHVVFVTIDPEYDTPGHLKSFIGHFNKDFIGLSGTQEQVDYIVSLYQAEYNKLSALNVPTKEIRRVNPKLFADAEDAKEDKASLYSHTVTLYLIDKEGYTRSLEYTGTPLEEFTSKIRQLINE
ncbi:MAG: SCO family protein [Piscirickettsiaceae bacterium]|nr:SCO family protein [Piscirickettsiaceae bacterium]